MTTRRGTRNPDLRMIDVKVPKGERLGPEVARKLLPPVNRHAVLAMSFAGALAKRMPDADKPSVVDWATELKVRLDRAELGDLHGASGLLLAQALSLDGIFTDTARRATAVIEYPDAFDRYLRLAMKAQAQSRATLEALARLHQPREQTVRHVHVNQGGQAIVADEFHHHNGGEKNAEVVEQPHATGAGSASTSPTLPSPDPIGKPLPSAGRERKPALQNARRQRKWSADGQ